MLTQLDRYIGMQLLTVLLLVAGSLTGIIWLTQALRFVDYIVNRGVSTLTFLQLTGLLVPSLLFIILPFAVFVSVIFIYHRMGMDSELVVLRSAGRSRWQLARPVVVVAGGTMLFAYFLSLYLVPLTFRQFKDMQSFLRDNYASLMLQEDVFNTPVKGLTVFLRQRHKDGTLEGLLVHDNRDEAHPITMMAQRGRIEQGDNGPRFLLTNGNRQEVNNGRFSFLKFAEYTMDLSFYTKESSERNRKPDEYFLNELFDEAARDKNRRSDLLAEAHHRLSWPIYSLLLGLLGFGALMRGEFNRRGMGMRLVVISLAAISLIAIALAIQSFSTKAVQYIPLIYLNLLLLSGLAIWMLREPSNPAIPIAGEGMDKRATA